MMKSGFVAIVGRPNTGKSTLINALVGQKIAITSHHPNTTRHAIRGIITSDNFQAVLVDTPGVHKPKTMLGQRLNEVVGEVLEGVDLVLMTFPANEPIGEGDRHILQSINSNAKKFAVVTKIDLVSKEALPQKLLEVGHLAEWDEIIPVSAMKSMQIEILLSLFQNYLPEGPKFYPDDQISDQSIERMIAEQIREAAIKLMREELPHSITVTVEELSQRENRDLIDIHATIHVERDSQRAIILGHKGETLKEIGTQARSEIEKLLSSKCFLGLHVKVSKDWQRDPKLLERLGFAE